MKLNLGQFQNGGTQATRGSGEPVALTAENGPELLQRKRGRARQRSGAGNETLCVSSTLNVLVLI